MKNKRSLSALACIIFGLTIALSASIAIAQGTPAPAKPSIVLVHGAFADASGWSHVIPLLEKEGYTVTAVQNPLTSFETDVETTKRMVAAQTVPVVLVGHSYGGAVITAASVGATNIKSLVYIAAFGPDSGEALGPLLEKYPSLIGTSLVPDAAGYLYIDRAKFNEAFANDVNPTEQRVMAATQKPINSVIFGQVFGAPGWKNIPSWYLVATQDNAINPEMQRMFANRMKAKTNEVESSHVPFISKPEAVAKVIMEAANSK